MTAIDTPLGIRRFAEKIQVADGCMIWTAALNSKGYPVFSVYGRVELAHRVSYETFVGPIPEGLQLDHLCRDPRCVNPDHLEPVTARENIRRSSSCQSTETHCTHGHAWTPETERYSKHGWRRCLVCARESARRSASRRAA